MAKQSKRTSAAAVGRRLRQLRKRLGYTQRQMARVAGVSTPAWNNYERGGNSPRWQTALRVARRFGASLDWIYGGEGRLGGPEG